MKSGIIPEAPAVEYLVLNTRTAAADQGCSLQPKKVEPLAALVHLQNADHMRCVAGLAIGL